MTSLVHVLSPGAGPSAGVFMVVSSRCTVMLASAEVESAVTDSCTPPCAGAVPAETIVIVSMGAGVGSSADGSGDGICVGNGDAPSDRPVVAARAVAPIPVQAAPIRANATASTTAP